MARKRSHIHAPDRPSAPRRFRALLALTGLVVLCVVCGLASGASASGGDGGFNLSVTQCDPQASDQSQCTETSQTLAPKPKKKPAPTTTVITVAPSKPKPTEVHELSLQSGVDKVTTLAGKTKSESANLSDNLKKQEQKDNGDLPADLGPQTLPTVRTDGGSPFAGFGSGFDFVSGDEALARFAIPPFLEPIYYAAGQAYNVPWNVLAAINSIETDFGRIENQVSSAGALGWMQFMPDSWKRYGVDATGDGVADPWNPVDAIYAAARYLKAAGAETDLRKAILAYNHAGWYADSVLKTASIYGSLPQGLVAESGSLAYGRFPVRGPVSYGDDFRAAQQAGARPDGLRIDGQKGALATATQEVTVKQILLSPRLAQTLTEKRSLPKYGLRLGRTAPVALDPPVPAAPVDIPLPSPTVVSQLGALVQSITHLPVATPANGVATAIATAKAAKVTPHATAATAAPARPKAKASALPDGYGTTHRRGIAVVVEDAFGNSYRYSELASLAPRVRPGAKLSGGDAIGRLADRKPELLFSVQAAGGAPVDPRPLVDGYRLQEAAGFYHVTDALGGNPFVPTLSALTMPGGTISGSASDLGKRVLADPGIQIYPCGREDIQHGIVDRRVLGALLYLRKAGLTLTITSLRCGHGYYTSSGNVSAHSYGAAVDIAAFNGQPVLGHQGPGSLTEQAIKLLMQLQGDARPAQLISLMTLGGPSFAMADHYNHLHVGYTFQPALGLGRTGNALGDVKFSGGGSLLGGISTGKVGKAVEEKFSAKLAKIRNPHIRHAHGLGSVRVEAEHRGDSASARRLLARQIPLRLVPGATGPQLDAIDVPDGAARDEAYAVGRVDGAGRPGWAPRQTVVLRSSRSGWAVVGAPRDRHGRIANPRLDAIASVAGGTGYAVGQRGALVLLRGNRSPLVLASRTKSALRSVTARRVGGRLTGYAAGDRHVGIALAGRRVTRERTPASLGGLFSEADGTLLAVASNSSASPALYRRGSRWSREALDFNLPTGAAVHLTAVSDGRAGLWLAGGISDTRTVGTATEMPFAAQQASGGWQTWCAGAPALAAVTELGSPSPRACQGHLTLSAAALGPASDLAQTSKGVVLATPAGLQFRHSNDFQLVPDASAPSLTTAGPAYSKLALSSGGLGWAMGTSGRVSRVVSATGRSASSNGEALPVAGSGTDLKLAVAYGGRHALAAGAGDAGAYAASRWAPAAGSGLRLRDLAWLGDATAWGLEQGTGYLVSYGRNAWTVPGANSIDAQLRTKVLRALGGQSLQAGGSSGVGPGLQALAIGRDRTGFAVGTNGLIARYANGTWSRTSSPTVMSLRSVAVGAGRAVAAGDQGTLLEYGSGHWSKRIDVPGLVRGEGFTAVDVMRDGTALAGGTSGALVEQRGPGKSWTAAPLQPLGARVVKLRGYRAADGTLRALALVRGAGVNGLLVGDARGWRAVGDGLGMAVADFDLDRATGTVWVAGARAGHATAVCLRIGKGGMWRPEAANSRTAVKG